MYRHRERATSPVLCPGDLLMPRPRRLPTVLTPTEVTALLRVANPRYRTGHRSCLMQLMLNVGCGRGSLGADGI